MPPNITMFSLISRNYFTNFGKNQEAIRPQLELVFSFEKFFIGVDLNYFVGSIRVGFYGEHEGFRYNSKNQEKEDILNFVLAYNLIILNILGRKRASNLLSFNNGQPCM
jgi:hypothetical protein